MCESRLELVAGHMAVNLVTNVEAAIGVEKVTEVHCWLDSTVALYWINGQGEYRQFVANRVKKIHEHERVIWHHVTTDQNPADLGSRGGYVTNSELWQHGPSWLSDKTKWPPEIALKPSKEIEAHTPSSGVSNSKPTMRRVRRVTRIISTAKSAQNRSVDTTFHP